MFSLSHGGGANIAPKKRRRGQRLYPLSPANRPKRDPLKSRVCRRRAICPLTTRHHPRWSQGHQRLRAMKELRRHPGRRLGPGRTGTKGTAPNCSHPSSEIREQTAPDRSRRKYTHRTCPSLSPIAPRLLLFPTPPHLCPYFFSVPHPSLNSLSLPSPYSPLCPVQREKTAGERATARQAEGGQAACWRKDERREGERRAVGTRQFKIA